MQKIKYAILIVVIAFPFASYGRTTYIRSSDSQDMLQDLSPFPIRLLSMPVLFGVSVKSISPNFGDPRSGGRTHTGEDIIAAKGTPVVSPTQAVVLRTEVGDSEGNAVYTANPGGETYVYIHLDRFGEGVKSGTVLKPGDLIGYVGDTGNALGGPAHLHFEVHNASSTSIDPFPLLVSDLPTKDKIADLSRILKLSDDPKTLANFLVTTFPNEFVNAKTQEIVLPPEILDALVGVPAAAKTVATTTVINTNTNTNSNTNTNTDTIQLQKYLITKNTGPAALALSNAGSTGNFGPLTIAALTEFQTAVGIAPAVGYYGPITQAFVTAHPIATFLLPVESNNATSSVPSTINTPRTVVTPATSTSTIRDLQIGMSGEDVRELQRKLNANGYAVASSGPGSIEDETSYFGPATKEAVIQFQKDKGISPSVGYAGPLTRAAFVVL